MKATERRSGGQGGGQLYFTNRELREFMKGRLKGYILEGRRKVSAAGRKPPRIYDISQNDNAVHCECEQCLAARELWGLSGLLVDFINDIASSVTNEFPDD